MLLGSVGGRGSAELRGLLLGMELLELDNAVSLKTGKIVG